MESLSSSHWTNVPDGQVPRSRGSPRLLPAGRRRGLKRQGEWRQVPARGSRRIPSWSISAAQLLLQNREEALGLWERDNDDVDEGASRWERLPRVSQSSHAGREAPLGRCPEGQRSPGRLDIVQGEILEGAGRNRPCPCAQRRAGGQAERLSRKLWLGLSANTEFRALEEGQQRRRTARMSLGDAGRKAERQRPSWN